MKAVKRILSVLLAFAMLAALLSNVAYAGNEAPALGPVTSKDVVYQIITDRFFDGDTSNNTPDGLTPRFTMERVLI